MDGDDDKFVPLLVNLEAPRFQSTLDGETAVALVRYALTGFSDYWADKALDWVEFGGVPVDSVAGALRACADDERWPQSLRPVPFGRGNSVRADVIEVALATFPERLTSRHGHGCRS